MKSKQIIILASILGVLMFGVLIRQCTRPAELVTQEYAPLDLSFDPQRAGKISITQGHSDQNILLIQDAGGWRISSLWNARADQDKIDSFLKEIREAKGELRSRSQDLFGDFAIGDAQAFRIEIQDPMGSSVLDLKIGAKKNSQRIIFIRKGDSDKVYLTDANLFGMMGLFGDPARASLRPDFWVSTKLVEYETAEVNRLEIHHFSKRQKIKAVHVERTGETWNFSQPGLPFRADSSKITSFLDSLKNWRAQTVLDPKTQDYGFSNPSLELILGFEDKEDIVITGGGIDEASKAYFMRVSSEPVVYRLTHFYFENMNTDDSHFFLNNPLEVEPDKVERLLIRANRRELTFAPKEKTWAGLTQYINDLKNFRVTRLLFEASEQRKVKSPSKYSLEVKVEGRDEPVVVDVGSLISKESKEYAAQLRDGTRPFAINDSLYRKVFEDLDRLVEPTNA